ncbi:MAG: hypothetical protein ACXVOI_02005 [Tumebacillaceae bacterium]
MTILLAEKFLGHERVDLSDVDSFEEIQMSFADLANVEYESEKFANLKAQTAMLLRIIDANTHVWYPKVYRTKHEVRNGYKVAYRRGAHLDEVEVFNLKFKFRGHLHGDGVALMCHGPNGEEWIMLCPDDTEERIRIERRLYMDHANAFVWAGTMNSTQQNVLLENLRCLTIGSRCANTLEHEYGHVLQHRIWKHEGIDVSDTAALYRWFLETGYADIVSMRIPHFFDEPNEEKIYLLKEAFVEDYRIGLNMAAENGIFELPNVYCFRGDFQEPELLNEGVNIVKKVLDHNKQAKPTTFGVVEYEPDRVAAAERIMSKSEGFDPYKSRMSYADHMAVLESMRVEQLEKQKHKLNQ